MNFVNVHCRLILTGSLLYKPGMQENIFHVKTSLCIAAKPKLLMLATIQQIQREMHCRLGLHIKLCSSSNHMQTNQKVTAQICDIWKLETRKE
jgi:hypothetical protein